MYQPTIPEDGAGVTEGWRDFVDRRIAGDPPHGRKPPSGGLEATVERDGTGRRIESAMGTASQLASGDFRASQWRASEWLG
jgi:hypothetical protein